MSNNLKILNSLKIKFDDLFKTKPTFYHAPGRINLIGEHTDYNDGFVLPAAIDKAIYFAVAKNTLKKLRLFSIDYNSFFEIGISELKKSETHWANYLIGVATQFQNKGLKIEGIDCVFGGDIPLGAGLSSSAALECGFAFCLNDQFKLGVDKSQLILMAQKAEHDYAGVKCGIMDQFASMFGKDGHVVKLDCRSLDYDYFPLTNEVVDIILCDTKVKHSLASSEYNIRRQECEKGVSIIKEKHPEVNSLRDVNTEMLVESKTKMSENVFQRCHFVVHEILRVEKACTALNNHDFQTFGKLMYETHEGLSKEYLVSCKELDVLVDIARKDPNVLGSRMMGGGFGGCTINLIKKGSAEKFIRDVVLEYPKFTGMQTEIYSVKISDGVSKVDFS
jgi:galactokinase